MVDEYSVFGLWNIDVWNAVISECFCVKKIVAWQEKSELVFSCNWELQTLIIRMLGEQIKATKKIHLNQWKCQVYLHLKGVNWRRHFSSVPE